MLGITLKMDAARDEVRTADGTVFDRSKMNKAEKRKLARLVSQIYAKHIEGSHG